MIIWVFYIQIWDLGFYCCLFLRWYIVIILRFREHPYVVCCLFKIMMDSYGDLLHVWDYDEFKEHSYVICCLFFMQCFSLSASCLMKYRGGLSWNCMIVGYCKLGIWMMQMSSLKIMQMLKCLFGFSPSFILWLKSNLWTLGCSLQFWFCDTNT